ncbi:DUF1338-domain-containing protein [Aaosphaeria arxii CBS 175.79]|uniref:2-oxoadipate dioxygenase/decarboxylase n=1 Tax=Aaosphaeria arxii CBS 175.79 TaxID=1450172 RepID=A0A6A5X7T5_9PLEO|nr:DUF1338-domain-containing protein [Aaosphaeria arxii CBS 175.79]KAF2008877.1 DUF1338-domain-containing protein [Aaosphaeria arxii CBS 175.79]
MLSKVLPVQHLPQGGPGKQTNHYVHPDDLRTAFALEMSRMYRNEVPLYSDLIRIVEGVNDQKFAQSINSNTMDRLDLERHGAIRLGKPMEMRTVCRIFGVLGMRPVGYYDLSAAGLPMHATCFRPTAVSSLAKNPFRIFTTLLRPELIRSKEAQDLAECMLAKRTIFSPELMRMLNTAESQDGLDPEQAGIFIQETLKTFSWAPTAAATAEEYQLLKAQHPILADIACFKTAHINHLTPRTLDITTSQENMRKEGMAVKDRIEGPPSRRCPILLRQTSFLALEEPIKFVNNSHDESLQMVQGSHKARFGEIEERGAAVTPYGRKFYDELLSKAMENATGMSPEEVDEQMISTFCSFPDDWDELRAQGLIYYEYECTGKSIPDTITSCGTDRATIVQQLLTEGVLETKPITYEDFLPFSAAGIFQSNLGDKSNQDNLPILKGSAAQDQLERALDMCIIDPDQLYASAQEASLEICLRKLGTSRRT